MALIEDLCAAVPAPDPARLAALRARLLDEAGRAASPGDRVAIPRSRPEGDVIAMPRPGGRTTGPPRGGRTPARRGRTPARDGRISRGRGGRILTWPRAGLAAAAAAAAAIALAVAGVLPFGGTALGPSASAAVLNRAAAAALAQPVPTDAQLIYTDSTVYYARYSEHGGLVPHGHVLVRQEEWQSPVSATAFFRTNPCDTDGDLQRGRGTCSFQGGFAPGAQAYSTYAGLRTLPTATGRLLAYLAGLPSAGHSAADREWAGANLVASLNPVLPPRFGAALFRAVARIPGAVLLPHAANAAGAHGIGVARAVAGVRQELIFDPGTYRLIGQQNAGAGPAHGSAAGHVLWATALRHVSFVGTGPGARTGTGTGTGGTGPVLHGTPQNGQFIYTQARVVALAPTMARRGARLTLGRASEQMWQSVDGSRPGAFDTAPCHAAQTCLVLIPPGPPALTTYAGLRALPRSPGALLSYLQQHAACPATAGTGDRAIHLSGAARQWNMVTALLGNNLVLPPGLGKALFEAAARIPGAVTVSRVSDAAGGRGIAVARNTTPSLRTELIFTPGSYRFIGVQEVLTRGAAGVRPGTVWAASSLVAARVVDTAPVTSLGHSYFPSTCGYDPGFYAIGGSAVGSSGAASSGASSGSSSSGSSSGSSSSGPP